MANVRPHSNQIQVRIRHKGTRYTTTVARTPTKTNLAAVQRQADQAKAELRAGHPWEIVKAKLRGERVTHHRSLGYYAQHFFDFSETEDSTLDGYQSLYDRYWAQFDDTDVRQLLLTSIQAHLASFSVGAKTKKNAVSVLRQILDIAVTDKALDEHPLKHWKVKARKTYEPDPYNEVERDKLIEALAPWPIAQRYFTTAFYTGARTGELLGLEWWALEKPYCLIQQTRVRRRVKAYTKTGDHRRVLLPQILWSVLDSNPTRFSRSFVFQTPEGRPFLDADWLMDKWNKAHTKAGVRRRTGPYPWRSTYISLALASGATLIWVKNQTGHDIVTMARDYARWIKGRENAEMLELEKIFGAQTGAQT